MKLMISISILVFGTFFGWIGQVMDHGNWLGGWSIILSGVGSLFGIWVAVKLRKYI